MRVVIACILFILGALFTVASSGGYANREGLIVDALFSALVIPAFIALLCCLPKAGRHRKRFFNAYNVSLLIIIVFQVKDLPIGESATRETPKPPSTSPDAFATAPPTATDVNTITSDNFSIKMPDTWALDTHEGSYIVRAISSSQNLVMYLNHEPAEPSFTLDNYARTIEHKFLSTHPDVLFSSPIAHCSAQNTACLYQIFNVAENEPTTYVWASLDGPEGHYQVMASVLTSEWETYADEVFNALASFELR
ncbi:hypothetical protein [Vreelandella sp. EE27]